MKFTQREALIASFETMNCGGRKSNQSGKLGVRHFTPPFAEELTKLLVERLTHEPSLPKSLFRMPNNCLLVSRMWDRNKFMLVLKNSLLQVRTFGSVAAFWLLINHPMFAGQIHIASSRGDANEVKALLEASPILVNSKDENGWTPLHFAARYGNTEIVKILLKFKADPSGPDKAGTSPIELADLYNHAPVVDLLEGSPIMAKEKARLDAEKQKRIKIMKAPTRRAWNAMQQADHDVQSIKDPAEHLSESALLYSKIDLEDVDPALTKHIKHTVIAASNMLKLLRAMRSEAEEINEGFKTAANLGGLLGLALAGENNQNQSATAGTLLGALAGAGFSEDARRKLDAKYSSSLKEAVADLKKADEGDKILSKQLEEKYRVPFIDVY
jgi:hypothetical protein